VTQVHRRQCIADLIVTLAARHRLPATTLSATTDGGLISYGQIR